MKKEIAYWGLYDFANSIMMATLMMYFSQWVILENGFNDAWYGMTFSLATFFVLIMGPFIGAWSDKLGKRKPFIFWLTLISASSGILLGIVAPSSLSTFTKVIIALVLFFIFQSGYQLSLIHHNALLNKLSTIQNRGKISAFGEFMGMLGVIIGIVVLLPVANGKFSLLSGISGRSQTFLPATVLFIIFSVPLAVLYKEKFSNVKKDTLTELNVAHIYKVFWEGLKRLFKKDRNVMKFLLSFYFINDALLTAQLFFAIYFAQVWGLADSAKTLVLLFLFIGILPGSLLAGYLCSKFSLKKLLRGISFYTAFFLLLIVFIKDQAILLYILMILLGFGWGSFNAVARTLFVNISPKKRLGEYFGFYSVFQRVASIIGPIIWSLTLFIFVKLDVIKYQIAMFVLVLMLFIGALILGNVKETITTS